MGKKARMSSDKEAKKEAELLEKIKDALTKEICLRNLDFDEEELLILKPFHFLTLKPIISCS